MTFNEVLSQTIAMLQQYGRVSYRLLKRQFDLDDDDLDDLKYELIEIQQLVVEQDGKMLIWTGGTGFAWSTPASISVSAPTSPAQSQDHDPASSIPSYLAEKILTSRRALEGERKQVTVMFCDIKDSTELIKDLDPEAAQQLLDPAIHIMMDAVHRFEGTVNQVLGDGMMALFGAPIAHEDHAARACYAALTMQRALQPYADNVRRAHGIEMRVRVGLNSGEVVVRTIGNDLHMDYSAVGPTVHLAARMEQMATPGRPRFTSSTLRLVEGMVQVNALGPIPIKGMTEPVEVYELTGASAIRRRLQAAVARGLTRFVGRETEIDVLHQACQHVADGNGQIVAAVGEAGVGKSRLVYEFIHSHRTQGWLVLESASVSYGKATPYFPVVDLLKRYAHVEEGDELRTIRAKVTGHILTLDESLQATIPPLLSLLEALPEDSPFLQLDPRQRRQQTLDGLKRILLRESQDQPLLLVFEDLHWIDSETQALLDRLVDSLPTSRMLLLVNYRPEYQHGWGGKTYYTQLRLDPLQPESAEAFLAALLGNDPGLEALKKLLIERTEGNPFFLEESVRTLVETRALDGEPGAYCLVRELPAIQVPATVQAILAARIDRLPPEVKQLLQTAAVIGTEVSLPLLQALAELPADVLHDGLTHLQAAEFLYETQLFPEHEYTFKHALTHEVAYGSLLQERRRVLHARIVDALETLGGDRLAEQVERLAHHALRSEVWDKALVCCQQAGERAMARSAYREAAAYFEQALSALTYLSGIRDRREQAIDLRLALRTALFPFDNSERILTVLHEAESLAMDLDDPRRLAHVYLFLSVHFQFTGEHNQALATAQRALALGVAGEDVVLQALAHGALGRSYQLKGDYRRAIDCFEQCVAFFDWGRRHERFGQAFPPAVRNRSWLAECHAELGRFAAGKVIGEETLRIAEAIDHPGSLMIASHTLGLVALQQGDLQCAIPRLEWALGIYKEMDLPFLFSNQVVTLGAAYTLDGRMNDALSLLTQIMEQSVAMQRVRPRTLCSLHLGEAQLLAGHLEAAQVVAEQALTLAHDHQEQGYEAYALCLLGHIAVQREPSDVDQAAALYQQALALASELGMRPLQAHCHRALGMLYRQTGQAKQARAELSTAIDMYRDMEMTFWLPETEATLAQADVPYHP